MMKKPDLNKKVIFAILAVSAIAVIPESTRSEYGSYPANSTYPAYPTQSFPPQSTYSSPGIMTYPNQTQNSNYGSYQERIRASEQRHQDNLDLIWGN